MDPSLSAPEPVGAELPTIAFSPAGIIRCQTGRWRGMQANTVQLIRHEPFECSFKDDYHLLIAIEQGARYDGETFVEGLPRSTLRNYSNRLIFVPAGRQFFSAQTPRLLTRSICVYLDPRAMLIDPDLRFDGVELEPGLLFENSALWETVVKLKAQIGSDDPADRMYAEALGGVLAHELLRSHGGTQAASHGHRAGLAPWQQKRVLDFLEQHLVEDVSLKTLADLVRLSPYHFLRSFKQSFGETPHRYWTARRIERAKELLANPRVSITEIAFDVGFSGTSGFSTAFHRLTGQTPTEYRRSLE
jgi:AraC family transcriptional regulator